MVTWLIEFEFADELMGIAATARLVELASHMLRNPAFWEAGPAYTPSKPLERLVGDVGLEPTTFSLGS